MNSLHCHFTNTFVYLYGLGPQKKYRPVLSHLVDLRSTSTVVSVQQVAPPAPIKYTDQEAKKTSLIKSASAFSLRGSLFFYQLEPLWVSD